MGFPQRAEPRVHLNDDQFKAAVLIGFGEAAHKSAEEPSLAAAFTSPCSLAAPFRYKL
jgi:hypothetical protein